MPRWTASVRRAADRSAWVDLVVGGVEADLESFGLAGPAFAFGLSDAGQEVVADLFEAVPLGGSLDCECTTVPFRLGVHGSA